MRCCGRDERTGSSADTDDAVRSDRPLVIGGDTVHDIISSRVVPQACCPLDVRQLSLSER